MMTELRHIALTVNGEKYEVDVEPRLSLAECIREKLGLTGTHVGCEHGVCGACTVLVNGLSARSCLMLAVQADGADVMTVEGLAGPEGRLSPIQQAFTEEHGLQCGFCTPGMLMASHEMLTDNPDPSEEEIMDVLGGQLCRCTGYQGILRAVKLAASEMRSSRSADARG